MTAAAKRFAFLPLLALLAGAATAATQPEARPRPENYANYGQYVSALVEYERTQDAAARKPRDSGFGRDTSQLCRDVDMADKSRSNSCQGKYLKLPGQEEAASGRATEELSDTFAPPPRETSESLEAAVASAGFDPVSAANADALRRSNRGMTLQEISVDELASAGVEGLLGIVNNIRMQNLNGSAAPRGAWGSGSGGNGGAAIDPDGSLRLSLDDVLIELDRLDLSVLSNLVVFGGGYGIAQADVSINAQGGLHMDLSTEIYTGLNVVDRDGLPGTEWAGAGALTLDRMEIFIPYLSVDIQGIDANFYRRDDLLQITAYSPGEIYANLANTRIGAAAATVDGSWIGPSTTFIEFGPTSRLTIAGGTRMDMRLSKPDGLDKALVMLNGRIGDIELNDMRLVDSKGGGSVGFKRVAATGIELVDALVFIEDRSVTIDAGTGLTNVGVDLERVWLGRPVEGQFIGDFYVRGGRVQELRMTATPH